MLISIKWQHLFFGWMYIPGIQFRFWTSLIHVEHCSVIPLIWLCYTLSWSRHQNVVTRAQLGCIEIFGLLVFTRLLIGYYVSYTISCRTWESDTHCLGPLVPWHGAMTFGISGHWIIWNCLNMSFFKKSGSRFKNNPLLLSYWFISTK